MWLMPQLYAIDEPRDRAPPRLPAPTAEAQPARTLPRAAPPLPARRPGSAGTRARAQMLTAARGRPAPRASARPPGADPRGTAPWRNPTAHRRAGATDR